MHAGWYMDGYTCELNRGWRQMAEMVLQGHSCSLFHAGGK